MQRVHSLVQDGIEDAEVMASRRSLILGSLKLAGGGAVALAIAGSPGIARLAAAENHEGGQDGGGGGGGQDGGGGGRDGQDDGGGGRGGRGGQDGQGAGQVNGVPRTGVGIAGSEGQTAGLIGLAAAGAAAAAFFLRQRTSAEQPTDG